MRYLLLIHVDESLYPQLSNEEQEARMAGYLAFGTDHQQRLQGGEALHGVATATAVRVRDGRTLVTDGPFAETKEQLNGYYLVDCESLDEAVALAAAIPDAARGTVEVRPIMEFDQA